MRIYLCVHDLRIGSIIAVPCVLISNLSKCNMHLDKWSELAKRSVSQSGMIGFRFNTIGVSDGISSA